MTNISRVYKRFLGKLCMTTGLTVVFLTLSSCSMVRDIGTGQLVETLYEARPALYKEGQYRVFRESVLSQYTLLSGLYETRPEDETLLRLLVEASAGVAFGVYETEALPEILLDADDRPYSQLAVTFYRRSVEFGAKWLKSRGHLLAELRSKGTQATQIAKEIAGSMSDQEKESLFFLAQAWGGLINLDRENVKLLTDIPLVEALMNESCSTAKGLMLDQCDLALAALDLVRPPMMGGNPKRARRRLQGVRARRPALFLTEVMELQFDIIPRFEEERFQRAIAKLDRAGAEFNERERALELNGDREGQDFALFNAIAFRRSELIKGLKKELFE